MNSRIVLGDVHGCFDTFLALVGKLPKDIPITITGDLIDRGPKSAQMVQYCIDNDIDVVKGNHEDMMVAFFEEFPELLDGKNTELREWDAFICNGGYKTLTSYQFVVKMVGVDRYIVTPPDNLAQIKLHLNYMKQLPIYIEYPDVVDPNGRMLVVSHSSINSVYKWRNDESRKEQFEQTVLWGRPTRIKDVPKIYSIFGHTPQYEGPRIKVPFANVDTGCCYDSEANICSGLGVLTSLQYPEMVVVSQENVDDY